MLDFAKKSKIKTATSQVQAWLVAFLFLVAACSSVNSERVSLGGTNQTFTTSTNLQLEGITTPITLRVTITKDGEVVSDEVQNYEEDSIHSGSGSVPLGFTKSYELDYEPHTFDFAVYYCGGTAMASVDDLEAAIADETAVLLGSASQSLDVDRYEEDLPPVTINIAEGDAVSGTIRVFFPSEPVFNAETITTTDCSTSAGQYSSLALDSNGDAHVSFLCETSSTADRLGYVYQSDGVWQTPWVLEEDNDGDGTSDNVGQYCDIAIDSLNDVYFSYYDASNGDARYISAISGDTSFGTSDDVEAGTTSRPVGRYTSLALYETGGITYPHFSFQRYANATQSYASFANDLNLDDTWSTYNVHSLPQVDNGRFTTIEFGSENRFHMAYLYRSSTSTIYYLGFTSCPHTATSRAECSNIIHNGSLGTTSIPLSNSIEQSTALAIDSDDVTHILYYDYTNGDLKHAYGSYSTSAWTVETITDGTASAGAGQYSAIAIDSYGKIHIAYYDADTTSLQYKQGNAGDDWSLIMPVEIDNSADVGQFVSMKLDEATATVHVAYYDATSGSLKYAVSE